MASPGLVELLYLLIFLSSLVSYNELNRLLSLVSQRNEGKQNGCWPRGPNQRAPLWPPAAPRSRVRYGVDVHIMRVVREFMRSSYVV